MGSAAMNMRHLGRKTISYRPVRLSKRISRSSARVCADDSWSDFFCGAGGSSVGITKQGRKAARRRGKLILAVNHWKTALESHNANFPDAHHELADMSVEDPWRYPRTRFAWFSPECKYHTNARGAPAAASQQSLWSEWEPEENEQAERSRATMGDVIRFSSHHRYDYVVVENVVEILGWPAFRSWWEAMTVDLEYTGRKVFLNSMFCWPTPQSRDRLYCVFTRKGLPEPDLDITPTAWCGMCERDVAAIQSWKPGRRAGKYRQQYVYCCPLCAREVIPYYYCAANAIDWSLPIQRIGDRKHPLKAKTLERIARGLERYSDQPLVTVASGRRASDGDSHTLFGHPLPMGTPHAMHSSAAVRAIAPTAQLVPLTRDDRSRGIEEPLPCQTATLTRGLLVPGNPFLFAPGSGGRPQDVFLKPFPTQTTHAAPMLVMPWLIEVGHGGAENSGRVRSTTDPLATQHTRGGMGLVQYVGTVATADSDTGGALPHPYLITYNGESGVPHSVMEPAATITSVLRHGLAIPGGAPCLEDCYFRTLRWHEVRAGMAFPADYILYGDSSIKIVQLGNAVTPPAAELLADRIMAVAA